MKRIVIVSVLIYASFCAYSQVQVGLFAGPQTSTVRFSTKEHVLQPNGYKYNFQAGATLKVPFDGHLYFAPSLLYSLKGYTVTMNNATNPPDTNALNNNTTIHTIEVAPLLQFDLSNKPSHFFIRYGFSVEVAMAGHEKYDVKSGGSVSQPMKFGFTHYGRYGANEIMQLGYESNGGFYMLASYHRGLGNMSNVDEGPTIKYRAVSICFGIYLNRKKIVIDTHNKE